MNHAIQIRRFLSTLLVLLALAGSVSAAASPVVNVNTADLAALQNLPRVGPAVAARIVEFRETNGDFETKSDLMLVRGIGPKTFELLEPYIVLEGETTLTEKVRQSRATQAEGDR